MTRAERVEASFQWPVIIAAVMVIPAIVVEQSATTETWSTVALVLNWAIWIVFAAEFVSMLWVVPDRWQYVRSHKLDVAIVVLTPPVLPPTMQAARALRLLRVLRLVKTASVLRRVLSAEGIRDAAVLAGVTVVGGGAAFAAVERTSHESPLSTWDGVWWAMTTVTTVGYGDISPQTDEGRVIAMTVMLVGIGFVALITAAAAERFVRGPQRENSELAGQLSAMNKRLEQLEHIDRLLGERHRER